MDMLDEIKKQNNSKKDKDSAKQQQPVPATPNENIIQETKLVFSGTDLPNHRNPYKLHKELSRCKPSLVVTNAFISHRNELIIKTNCKKSLDELKTPWPADAFGSGIKLIIKANKYYAAILNVDVEVDFEEESLKEHILKEYGITRCQRLVKKSTTDKKKLRTIKIEINSKDKKDELEKKGMKLGYTIHKVVPWVFTEGPILCAQCQQYGHKKQECRAKEACQLCGKEGHNHNNCKESEENRKCLHCEGKHAASSKLCSHRAKLIEDEKEKREASQKAKSQQRPNATGQSYAKIASQNPAEKVLSKKIEKLEELIMQSTIQVVKFFTEIFLSHADFDDNAFELVKAASKGLMPTVAKETTDFLQALTFYKQKKPSTNKNV